MHTRLASKDVWSDFLTKQWSIQNFKAIDCTHGFLSSYMDSDNSTLVLSIIYEEDIQRVTSNGIAVWEDLCFANSGKHFEHLWVQDVCRNFHNMYNSLIKWKKKLSSKLIYIMFFKLLKGKFEAIENG